MRVLLVEEHPERERLSLLFLRHALARRGHEVHLGNTWSIERDFGKLRPDVVVDNVSDGVGHYAGKLSMLGDGHRNVNLIWEQMLNPLSLFRFRFDRELSTRFVDGRVAWGDAFRAALLAENPEMDPSRVRACGSIKHAVYRRLASVPRETLLPFYPETMRRFARRVLLVDSFPATRREAAVDRAMRDRRSYPYMFETVSYLRELKQKALELYAALADRSPDTLFVFRVHPNKFADYRAEFAALFDSPNVMINSAGEIGPLIRLCDLVVAARSGTTMDAWAQGVAAVNLELARHPFRSTLVVGTPEEAFAAPVPLDEGLPTLRELERAAGQHRVSDALARSWFTSVELDAVDNVAAFIEDIAARPGVPKRLQLRSFASPFVARRFLRNRVRLAGFGRSHDRPPEEFPYDAVFQKALEPGERMGSVEQASSEP